MAIMGRPGWPSGSKWVGPAFSTPARLTLGDGATPCVCVGGLHHSMKGIPSHDTHRFLQILPRGPWRGIRITPSISVRALVTSCQGFGESAPTPFVFKILQN